jgi:LPXTG-site transpeptidase (sortase) family protein
VSRVHRAVARRLSQTLAVAGVLALAYAAYLMIDAHAYQTGERRRLAEPREIVAAASVPVSGDSIGEMDIPRLGVRLVIVQGDSPSILARAVGHVADTALPGEAGNVVLAGRRDTFRLLEGLRRGDVITVTTQHGDFDYAVESAAMGGSTAVDVLASTSGRTLTLITRFAPKRFVVRARETTVRGERPPDR